MRSKVLLSLVLLLTICNYVMAEGEEAPGLGGPGYKAPIDTYQVVLIAAAVLLTVGAIAYKKLSLKKA